MANTCQGHFPVEDSGEYGFKGIVPGGSIPPIEADSVPFASEFWETDLGRWTESGKRHRTGPRPNRLLDFCPIPIPVGKV